MNTSCYCYTDTGYLIKRNGMRCLYEKSRDFVGQGSNFFWCYVIANAVKQSHDVKNQEQTDCFVVPPRNDGVIIFLNYEKIICLFHDQQEQYGNIYWCYE